MFLPGLHTIVSDNDQGIRISLDYVRSSLKKTKVALVCGPLSSKAFNERLAAYRKYMILMGFEQREDFIVYAESFGYTSGYNAIRQLIERAQDRPEVVLVASDDIALGVLKGLRDLQIRVPEDIQVIGFDDIAFAKHFTPSLTTIAQDRRLLGETAARRLIELIQNPDCEPEEITKLPVRLIERESTSPIL
jgi:LacI family transcriptional regulator